MLLSQEGYVLSIEHLDCYRLDSWKPPAEAKQSSLIKLTNTEQTVTFNFVGLIAYEQMLRSLSSKRLVLTENKLKAVNEFLVLFQFPPNLN